MSARNCLSAVMLVAIILLGASCEGSYKSPLQGSIKATDVGAVLELPAGVHEKPIKIRRAITIKGESGGGTILEVTSDTPAIEIASRDKIVIDSLTIKWQLATSDGAKKGPTGAIVANDATVILRNCRIIALGSIKRSPRALHCDGFSNVAVENCRFEGFEFTIAYTGGAEGIITDSVILNPGHCGATVFSGSKMEVARTIVTGSGYHALRNTGGTILAHDNLIINNKNRGFYLGNKSGHGRINNNVILGNGSGVSGFAASDQTIENNIMLGNDYCGLDTRDSCRLTVRNNIFQDNPRGIALHEQTARNNVDFGRNTFWQNDTNAENIDLPEGSIVAAPGFVDPDNGHFTVQGEQLKANSQGLTDPGVFGDLWDKWKAL